MVTAQPAWFQRLPEIPDTLMGMSTDPLDRQAAKLDHRS